MSSHCLMQVALNVVSWRRSTKPKVPSPVTSPCWVRWVGINLLPHQKNNTLKWCLINMHYQNLQGPAQSRTNRFLEPHLLHKPAADIWALFMIKMLQGYGLKNPMFDVWPIWPIQTIKNASMQSILIPDQKNSLPHRSQPAFYRGAHHGAIVGSHAKSSIFGPQQVAMRSPSVHGCTSSIVTGLQIWFIQYYIY